MIELQLLNKVLKDQSVKIIIMNNLTSDHFINYQDEFNFIMNHYKKFNKVPDKETFLAKFSEFGIIEVTEPEKYLIDTINEEHLYYKSVPVVNKIAELLNTNSNDAVEYLLSQVPKLTASIAIEAVDLIKQAQSRFDQFAEMHEKEGANIISTGLKELDEAVSGGWLPGEDLITLMARTNQGKSWLLDQFAAAGWSQNYRVGLYSGEMSANVVGYRMDTLLKNFSNEGLMRGYKNEFQEYLDYIKNLQTLENPLIVVTPKELGGRATVSKLCGVIEKYELEMLVVDQYSLMIDEKSNKGDPPRIMYGRITDGLLEASCKYRIPIIGAVQANRAGAKGKDDEGTPELEHISESDLIAQNSTRVVSMRQTGAGLEMETKKNRYGKVGGKVIYYWDIDRGTFKYVPSGEDVMQGRQATENRNKFQDGSDVF